MTKEPVAAFKQVEITTSDGHRLLVDYTETQILAVYHPGMDILATIYDPIQDRGAISRTVKAYFPDIVGCAQLVFTNGLMGGRGSVKDVWLVTQERPIKVAILRKDMA